jgi:addiction module RelE/StbE family toxin
MARIIWTDFAVENLNDIGDYIARDSQMYARLVVKELFDSVTILKQHLLAGRMVPEYERHDLREIIRGNYRIVYRLIDESTIDIITVHHSARLLNTKYIEEEL